MKRLLLLTAALALALAGRAADRTIVLGLVAKSQGNPVFQAARVGAEDAAREMRGAVKTHARPRPRGEIPRRRGLRLHRDR